jgi:hypothetical protein
VLPQVPLSVHRQVLPLLLAVETLQALVNCWLATRWILLAWLRY